MLKTKLMMTLIRGVPGSGKSTKAQTMKDDQTDHWEADMFFIDDFGNYNFNPKLLPAAHKWCQKKTKQSLKEGRNVIVANTFIHRWELQPYLELAAEFDTDIQYITCTGRYKSIHGVPEDRIEAMRNGFEDLDEDL
jgi:predicted kinase